MQKRAVSGIMLTLLLVSVLPLMFEIQPVKAEASTPASQEPPPTQWSQTYGGTRYDYAYSVIQTSDGGYVVAGRSHSYGAGNSDLWLVKTDSAGVKQWNRTHGGTGYDGAEALIQTSDGGYAIAGFTSSFGSGYQFYLVKTNSSGHKQWEKAYGGTSSDKAFSIVQTGDGGYALAGYTTSYGAGNSDLWLVKTDSAGVKQWSQTYGEAGDDGAEALIQTSDGGYAIAGYTNSCGAGSWDMWFVKTNSAGTEQWNKTYGGPHSEVAWSVIQTADSGYALAGCSSSFGAGYEDSWLVKTDSFGVMQWSQPYGGTGSDYAFSVVQVAGGYAIGSYTESYGAGYFDFWLIQTDFSGVTQWDETYGGTGSELAYCMIQTRDGGYALAGSTDSYGAGNYDFWLVKVAPPWWEYGFASPLGEPWTISQRFGRYNYAWSSHHLGEDILRNFEAPVYAPADGIVKHNAKRTGYGYVLIIEHHLADGTFLCSVLGHLGQQSRAQIGSTVTRGQIVGYLSSLPDENGGCIHLHYGIRKGQYSEEPDPDGKWRYRGYGPIDIVGSWFPPSAFIDYYNLHSETPPSYSLTINTEGGGSALSTGTASVFILVYKTILTLISFHPWFLQWLGTDNDILNPTTVTMDSNRAVTEIRSSAPPPTPPSPEELARNVLGKVYRTEFGNLATKGWEGGKFVEPPEVDFLDCSGLVFWSYNKAHDSKEYTWIYDGANAQFWHNFLTEVSENELSPGDALFFDWNNDDYMDHVAMYVGEYSWTGEIQPLIYYTTGGDLRQYAYEPIVTIENFGEPVEYSGAYNVVHASGDAGHSYGVRPDTVDRLKALPGFGGFRRFTGPVGTKIKSDSPIDLKVTDPDGFVITKDVHEIPGILYYLECDIDEDGELEDIVTAPEGKVGNYLVTVIPEAGASPEDTFTLEASANATAILLADWAQLSEIPTDPYIVTQNESAIMLRSINIAVTNITHAKDVVGQGYSSSINVTIQNQGNLGEACNVTLYANATAVATLSNINLASGSSVTAPIAWNTSGFTKGNYTISAYAIPVHGETYTTDNSYTDGTVLVTIAGDINGDGFVDIFDLSQVAIAYFTFAGDPDYDIESDINEDGIVDMRDITVVAYHYGESDS